MHANYMLNIFQKINIKIAYKNVHFVTSFYLPKTLI